MRMQRAAVAAVLLVLLCGCQQKVADRDLYDMQAELSGWLPYSVLQWQPLTTEVDRSAGTMETLFGNEAAAKAAREGVAYPDGAVLGLVTWREAEDPHWFGARIPGRPVSVEFVVVGRGVDERFEGTPWKEVGGGSAAEIEAMRVARIP
ncbi:MAG: cytochrome P460 family protein [Acidobacteriaceae bacterium]